MTCKRKDIKTHINCHDMVIDKINSDFIREFSGLSDLHSQILGGINGGLCDHQNRIGYKRMEQAYNRLKEYGFNDYGELIQNDNKYIFHTFEDLYDTIWYALREYKNLPIIGIGELTVYDIATRIGYCQKPSIQPKDYVYMHAGTRVGAKRLLKRRIKQKEPIQVFEKIDCLKGMAAWQIEDYLCIAKNSIN